jgi:hypothetical protein
MIHLLAAAAIAGCTQVTTQHGATFSATLSAAAGANCNQPWYLIVLNSGTKPQTPLGTATGNGPGTVSLTLPDSAFDATTCTVSVQTDVRFGGGTHGSTQRLPGSLKVTVTKPGGCVTAPSPSPTPSPKTPVGVLPSKAARPPSAVLGVQVARPGASLPFTGSPLDLLAVAAGALTAAGVGLRIAAIRRR